MWRLLVTVNLIGLVLLGWLCVFQSLAIKGMLQNEAKMLQDYAILEARTQKLEKRVDLRVKQVEKLRNQLGFIAVATRSGWGPAYHLLRAYGNDILNSCAGFPDCIDQAND